MASFYTQVELNVVLDSDLFFFKGCYHSDTLTKDNHNLSKSPFLSLFDFLLLSFFFCFVFDIEI